MTGRLQFISIVFLSITLPGLARAQATDVDCDKCVDSSDIARKAISTGKLRPEAVTNGKIRDGAVSNRKLSTGLSDKIEAARNPRVLDGTDAEIGQLISIGENRWSIEVITDKGYLLTVSPRDGEIGNGTVYFSNSVCSGTAYIDGSSFNGYVTNVFDDEGFSSLYYIAKDSSPVTNFEYDSLTFDDQGCFVQQGEASLVFPFLPNDPAITGVSSASFPLPIHIELP